MKKSKILFLFMLIMMSFGLTACGLSAEERDTLKQYVPLAESYYEEKYNCDIEIVDYSYNYYTYVFREYLPSEMYFTTSEDTLIFYTTYEEQFSDNRQSAEIFNKFETSLLPQLCDYIKNPYYWDYESSYVSCNMELIGDDEDKSFYHTYYDADNWTEFFIEEKPLVYIGEPLYIISSENTKYEQITEYVSTLFNQYMNISQLEIIFLSEDLYLSEPGYELKGEDGFYASYLIMGDDFYVTKQNYIKLADGVYITSLSSDFMYEDADFIVSEKMELKDAISVYEDSYFNANGQIFNNRETPYSFETDTGFAYKINFSEYYYERTECDTDTYHDMCVKIVPSELDENVTSFNCFVTQEDDEPDFRKYFADEENTTFYMFLHYGENSDMYFCLGTDANADNSDDTVIEKNFSKLQKTVAP